MRVSEVVLRFIDSIPSATLAAMFHNIAMIAVDYDRQIIGTLQHLQKYGLDLNGQDSTRRMGWSREIHSGVKSKQHMDHPSTAWPYRADA